MARILLVDDDSAVRDTLTAVLQLGGHTVISAHNGAVALQAIGKADAAFDVVLTDILMPDTDGLETIMRLRKTKNPVRIVAMSGGGRIRSMDMLDYAKQFGADAALAKPFMPALLLNTIEQVLERVT